MVAESTVSTNCTTVSTKELYEQTLKARRLHGKSAVAPLLEPYLDATRWPSGAPLPFHITEAVQKRPRGTWMIPSLLSLLVHSLLLGFNLCAVGCIATNRSYADGASLSTKTAVCAAVFAVAFPLSIFIFRAQLPKHRAQDRRSVWRHVSMLCVLLSLQESDATQRKALLTRFCLSDPTAPRVFWESAEDLSVPAQPTQPKTSPVSCLQSLLSFAEVLQKTRRQQGFSGCCFGAGQLGVVIPELQPYLGARHFKSGRPLPAKLCAELDLASADLPPCSCPEQQSVCQCFFTLASRRLFGCMQSGRKVLGWLVVYAAVFSLPAAVATTEQCPFGNSTQLIFAVAVLISGMLADHWLLRIWWRICQMNVQSWEGFKPYLDLLYLLYMQDHGVPAAEPADVVHKFKLGDVVYTSYSDGSYTEYPSSPPTPPM